MVESKKTIRIFSRVNAVAGYGKIYQSAPVMKVFRVLFQLRRMSSASIVQNINQRYLLLKQRKKKNYLLFLQNCTWIIKADELVKTCSTGGLSEVIIKIYQFPKIILPLKITSTFKPQPNVFDFVRTEIKIAVVPFNNPL